MILNYECAERGNSLKFNVFSVAIEQLTQCSDTGCLTARRSGREPGLELHHHIVYISNLMRYNFKMYNFEKLQPVSTRALVAYYPGRAGMHRAGDVISEVRDVSTG